MKTKLLITTTMILLLCISIAGAQQENQTSEPRVFTKVDQDVARMYKDKEEGKFYFVHNVIVDSVNCTNGQQAICNSKATTLTHVDVVTDATNNPAIDIGTAHRAYKNPGKMITIGMKDIRKFLSRNGPG